jgi:hypothetical protein
MVVLTSKALLFARSLRDIRELKIDVGRGGVVLLL